MTSTGNADQVLRWTRHAADQGAHLVAFPEMVLTGYPVEDLALRRLVRRRVARRAATTLAAALAADGLGELLVVVGYLDGAPDAVPRARRRPQGAPQNAAALLHRGAVVGRYAKHHLPNYGVFDEFRYFVPGAAADRRPACTASTSPSAICEDLWQDGGPVAVARRGRRRPARGHQRLAVRAEQGRRPARRWSRRRAAEAGLRRSPTSTWSAARTSWSSTATRWSSAADGAVLARAPQFEEELPGRRPRPARPRRAGHATSRVARIGRHVSAIERVVVADDPVPAYEPVPAPDRRRGSTTRPRSTPRWSPALRDYVAQERLPVGRARAVRRHRLGAGRGASRATRSARANVHGVSMPSAYSSEHSRSDAADLAERTGLHYRRVPIAPMVDGVPRRSSS